MLNTLGVIDRFIEKITSYFLIGSVFGMLLLSVLTIVLRWFGTSLLWIEPLVRHLVFLSAFLGGVIATGKGNHIAIDILGKYLESKDDKKLTRIVRSIIYLTCFLTLLWLVKSGIDFMKVELEYGDVVFWGIKSGVLVGIIPFGLGIIVFRFFYLFLKAARGGNKC